MQVGSLTKRHCLANNGHPAAASVKKFALQFRDFELGNPMLVSQVIFLDPPFQGFLCGETMI